MWTGWVFKTEWTRQALYPSLYSPRGLGHVLAAFPLFLADFSSLWRAFSSRLAVFPLDFARISWDLTSVVVPSPATSVLQQEPRSEVTTLSRGTPTVVRIEPGQLYLTIVNSISLDVIQAVPAEDGHRPALWELMGRAFPSVFIFLSILIIIVKIFSLFLPLCFEELPM